MSQQDEWQFERLVTQAREALALADAAAVAAGYGDQLRGALQEAIRQVEHVEEMLR